MFFLSRNATPLTLPATPSSLKASIALRSSFGADTLMPMAAKLWPASRCNMRILSPPDHHQFGLDLRDSGERVVAHAFAQTAFVNVRRVKADASFDFVVHRGSKGEMPSKANSHGSHAACAIGQCLEKVDYASRVGVKRFNRLGHLQLIPAFSAYRVIGKDFT